MPDRDTQNVFQTLGTFFARLTPARNTVFGRFTFLEKHMNASFGHVFEHLAPFRSTFWNSANPQLSVFFVLTFCAKTSVTIFFWKILKVRSIQYIYWSVLVVLICQNKQRFWKRNTLFNNRYLFEIKNKWWIYDLAFTTSLYYWQDVTFYHDLMILNPKTILMTFEEMRFLFLVTYQVSHCFCL